MAEPIINQLPEQKVRSGAIGRVGLVLCAMSLVVLALMVLLKPG